MPRSNSIKLRYDLPVFSAGTYASRQPVTESCPCHAASCYGVVKSSPFSVCCTNFPVSLQSGNSMDSWMLGGPRILDSELNCSSMFRMLKCRGPCLELLVCERNSLAVVIFYRPGCRRGQRRTAFHAGLQATRSISKPFVRIVNNVPLVPWFPFGVSAVHATFHHATVPAESTTHFLVANDQKSVLNALSPGVTNRR